MILTSEFIFIYFLLFCPDIETLPNMVCTECSVVDTSECVCCVENRGLDKCLDVIIQPILKEYELWTILQKKSFKNNMLTNCGVIT